MARELGWEEYAESENPRVFSLPETTLGELASELQSKLGAQTLRVVGDPKLAIKRVRANWGYAGLTPGVKFLDDPEVDALVCGEAREWELVEFAQDAVAAGEKKGLILIGHVASEQAGMKYCAEWLRGFVSEVPIQFVPAAEPMWRPEI